MNEIKFRLWNPERKVVTAGNHLNTIIMSTDKEFIKQFQDSKMKWLQFTGLKDRNETDIYEGDIVKITNAHHDGWENEGDIFSPEIKSDVVSEVFFHEAAFQFYYEEDRPVPLFGYSSDSEIIGNVYNNPELLEDDTDQTF